MTLKKQEASRNWQRTYQITPCGELIMENGLALSLDKLCDAYFKY